MPEQLASLCVYCRWKHCRVYSMKGTWNQRSWRDGTWIVKLIYNSCNSETLNCRLINYGFYDLCHFCTVAVVCARLGVILVHYLLSCRSCTLLHILDFAIQIQFLQCAVELLSDVQCICCVCYARLVQCLLHILEQLQGFMY